MLLLLGLAVTTMLWDQNCYEVAIECPMIVQDILIYPDLSKLHRMIYRGNHMSTQIQIFCHKRFHSFVV